MWRPRRGGRIRGGFEQAEEQRALYSFLAQATSPTGLVFLALGGNQGDTRAIFRQALARLEEHLGHLARAPLYRSAPLSEIEQADFLNTVVAARLEAQDSSINPTALLDFTQTLESAAGRRLGPRWGPRPLDLDLLLFGETSQQEPRLTLPHRRLEQRRFVLQPLSDLAPFLRLPPTGRTAAALLADLGREQEVEAVPWGPG